MKNKTTHTSSETKSVPKPRTPYATIKDLLGWRNVPRDHAIIDALCDHLLQWSLKSDSISIGHALRDFGIPRQTYYDWLKVNEKLQATEQEVKANIGDNMFHMGVTRKGEPSFLMRVIHQHNPMYAQATKEEQAFKRELATIKKDAVKEAIENLTIVEREVKSTEAVNDTVKRKKKNDRVLSPVRR